MSPNPIPLLLLAVGTGIQILMPGRPVYQEGWYVVLLAACAIWAVLSTRPLAAKGSEGRWAAVAFAIGAMALAAAAATSGLFAPQPRTVIGAPGERVTLEAIGGDLVFPVLADEGGVSQVPVIERPGRAPIPLRLQHFRYLASAVLFTRMRTVVVVRARSSRGVPLTVTQPTGNVFLSPVLLMTHRQRIAGLTLPYDTFAVPARRRTVSLLLFSPEQTARLRAVHGTGYGVLYAVNDLDGKTLPHGIVFAPAGEEVRVAGLRLRARIADYPAVWVAWIPSLPVTIAGMGALVIGGILAARKRS